MNERNSILDAVIFATAAHGTQQRKYTGEPYIVHPLAVARTIGRSSHGSLNLMKVAILHDVIEDTDVTYEDLLHRFGQDVASGVLDLTERFYHGNRAERKAAECNRLGNVCGGSQTVKIADLIDNTKSIVEHDPAFAEVYLTEKLALLMAMEQADPALKVEAYEQIWKAQSKLEGITKCL